MRRSEDKKRVYLYSCPISASKVGSSKRVTFTSVGYKKLESSGNHTVCVLLEHFR